MSENYIKKIEVFSNLISLSKILKTKIGKMAKELSVSHFELNWINSKNSSDGK